MIAREIMRAEVLTLRPEATLREAAAFLTSHRISGAPVVGPRRKLLGVISQTDLLRRGQEPAETEVGDVMTPAAYCADEETPAAELARFMLDKRIHRIIVARRGRLIGIITATDMLRALLESPKKPGVVKKSRRAAPA